MSKTFVYDRFDTPTIFMGDYGTHTVDINMAPASDGEWVKAEDAINRDAVLNEQIWMLEVQLKDARAFARLTRDAAIEEAASIADSCMLYATTTAQSIAKAIRAANKQGQQSRLTTD